MRAVIKSIDCDDVRDWEEVVRASTDPWQDGIYLTLGIGPEDEEGADWFQVFVCTARAKHRFVRRWGISRFFLVDSYDPATIQEALYKHVGLISGYSWTVIAQKLCEFMHWEYEGMEYEGMG